MSATTSLCKMVFTSIFRYNMQVKAIAQARQAFREYAFFKNNAIFWSASLFVSFLNYLYYPVLGRLMNPVSFGETQTIISIFTQATVFFQVLSLVSIGIINKYPNKETRNKVVNELSRLALIFPLLILLASVVFSLPLKHFFQFTTAVPFYVLALSLLVCVPLSFANSYLQGHKQFKSLSLSNILASATKLILAIILVACGLKTAGAIGGLVGAQIIALIYAVSRGQGLRSFVRSNLKFHRPDLKLVKPELPYAGMVLITSLTTNLLLSFDILIVKHYFPPAQAGLYTGISIISNIIYYVSGPFAAVMLPSIKQSQARKENYRILRNSLLITAAVGGLVMVIFLIAPHLIVLLLLGRKYAVYSVYLRGLSLALFIMSISNLFIYYHIGLRHFFVAPVVLVGLLSTIYLLIHSHATMGRVVADLVIGAGILIVLLLALMPYYRQKAVI